MGTIVLIAYSSMLCLLILLDDGGVYDPDPSADERYKTYQRQQRKEFFAKIKRRLTP